MREGSQNQHRPHEIALPLLEPEVAEEVGAAGPGERAGLHVGARGEANKVRVHSQLSGLLLLGAKGLALTLPGPWLRSLDLLKKGSSGRV